jgi:drug/metabolite transporter (DMT)-like permease
MRKPSPATRLAAGLAIVYVVWGSTFLAIRFALEGLPPLLMSALRNGIAGLLLLAWLRWRGAAWPTPRQWRNGVLVGFVMLSVGSGVVALAEQSVPSGLAALVVASSPVFAIMFGAFFGAWPRRLEVSGVVVGLAGMGLLQGDVHVAASPVGFALLVLAAAAWALASVLQPRLDMPAGTLSAGVQLLGGGACLALMSALRGERWPAQVPMQSWLALAYLVFFGSIVAYTAFVYVVAHARPALATSFAYVNPVVAVALGVLLGGETVSWPIVAGMTVILAGVGLVMIGSARRSA